MLIERIRKNFLRRAPLAGAIAALALAPTAQALEIGFGDSGSTAVSPSIVVTTDVRHQKLKIDIFGGGTMDFSTIVRTVEFTDGPIQVNDIRKQGLVDLRIKELGDDFIKKLPLENDGPLFLEELKVKTLDIAGLQGDVILDVDDVQPIVRQIGTPGSPVPEPGAALLFGAGLAAVALRSRR